MELDQVTTSTALAVAVRNLQAIAEAQVEVMQAIAASQQQMVEIMQASGVGGSVNVYA